MDNKIIMKASKTKLKNRQFINKLKKINILNSEKIVKRKIRQSNLIIKKIKIYKIQLQIM